MDVDQKLALYAPVFVIKYLDLAAFAILKLSRCHLSATFDSERGRRAYFYVINFNRAASVQAGDILSRTVGILTQLWASKNVFKRSNGSYDSLTLRCGSRLAMSVIYDCLWWWRYEICGQQYPYEDKNENTADQPIAPIDSIPSALSCMPTPSSLDSFTLNMAFPESQWATTHDLMSLDWSQFQYDPLLPLDDIMGDTNAFELGGADTQVNMPILDGML